MNKILANLVIIAIVLGASIGSTVAYFSEREISEDNYFVAGGLNLQVDSKSFYNTLECRDGLWIEDGFEELQCERTLNPFPRERIERDSTGAYLKNKCQNFGYEYTIAKWKWDRCQNEYVVSGEANETFVLGDAELATWESLYEIDGIVRKAGRYSDILSGGTEGEIDYRDNQHEIRAIYFCGGGKAICGNCELEKGEECDGASSTPEGFYCSSDCELVAEAACSGTWSKTDLQALHKFFEFSDIRFGDTGRDTISLHIDENNAWGRLVLDDILNVENTCTAPELFDEEACEADDQGELLENLRFTFWLDMGAVPGFQNAGITEDDIAYDLLEGNNELDEGEPVFFSDYEIELSGKTIDFKEILMETFLEHCLSRDANGNNAHGLCQGIAEDGRLVKDTNYFFAMSWMLPEKISNEIQSDDLSFDLRLEVEQHRHNDEPFN